MLPPLLRGLAEPVDLSNPAAFEGAQSAAEQLVNSHGFSSLCDLERTLASQSPSAPVLPQLAVKLAQSRVRITQLKGPVFLSVVFAVYKEHRRILTAAEDPLGEDFLRRKVAQLAWLTAQRSDVGFELLVVDDGCPEGSGHIAEKLIQEAKLGDRARVLFLERAIECGDPAVSPLRSASESQKGGSVLYGMAEAIRTPRVGHTVIFTDADLSTHLGQAGNLLGPIHEGALAALGSRREPTSVVIKGGARSDRGKLFIYLWKRLLPQLHDIVDTQCGFKAFDARVLPDILPGVEERRFAFDIELLLKTELREPSSARRVPVAWIDSEAASTTTDLQPYLPMLKSVAGMYRRLLPGSNAADAFADLIEQMDEAAWQELLESIPTAISEADPATFDTFVPVGADELRVRASGSTVGKV